MVTSDLEAALDHRFAQPELLTRALTHSSTAKSRSSRIEESNERLEFLGDRVLGLVVAEMLFDSFPDEDEGALARRHAALVRREALARVAGELDLADAVILARGEAEGGGRENPALLANVCEAVIAALYLDAGLATARGFIRRYWTPLMAADPRPPKDSKTALQEWLQARGRPVPAYVEAGREGPDHQPRFTVEVQAEGLAPERASGTSKRAAEQAAAAALLARLEAEEDAR